MRLPLTLLAATVLAGCAVAPAPTLAPVDVSGVPPGTTLSGLQIAGVVQGRQLVGTMTQPNGARVPGVVYAFLPGGSLYGVWPDGTTDDGKWFVDHGGGELCTLWARANSGCAKASVRGGKLLLEYSRGGVQLLQQ
jgi:hypothetical protein